MKKGIPMLWKDNRCVGPMFRFKDFENTHTSFKFRSPLKIPAATQLILKNFENGIEFILIPVEENSTER